MGAGHVSIGTRCFGGGGGGGGCSGYGSAAVSGAGLGGVGGGVALQPSHKRWLDQLLDAVGTERRAGAALRELQRQAAALALQRTRVEAEHGRLSERIRLRSSEVDATMATLRARRAWLAGKLEQEHADVAEGEARSSLGRLVQ
eukprot:324845-Chlamydomonas_euryale.AAC.2